MIFWICGRHASGSKRSSGYHVRILAEGRERQRTVS